MPPDENQKSDWSAYRGMQNLQSSTEPNAPTPAQTPHVAPTDPSGTGALVVAPVVDPATENLMGRDRKITREDIELVQNLIERCLQLYMNKQETINTLLERAKIDAAITSLIWQKLEEENAEFFRAYHIRLYLKSQITRLNSLLERQYELMKERGLTNAQSTDGLGNQFTEGYNMLQHPLIHAPIHPQRNLVGYSSNPQITDRYHHPMAMNMGREVTMNPGIPNTNLIMPRNEIISNNSSIPSSIQYQHHQNPFQPTPMPAMPLNMVPAPPTVNTSFVANPFERIQSGPYNDLPLGSNLLRSISIPDFTTSEFADFTVEQFLADFPAQGFLSEDDPSQKEP